MLVLTPLERPYGWRRKTKEPEVYVFHSQLSFDKYIVLSGLLF